ncbi:TRAP transporter substrate-binding protein [Lentibacter sp. XHP0401]|uniref:TRAP transporter substrate-binding protein n=1 Tax=Lentibacter sp. XHP0401 TaxID=2984334 RepID=UPI0021E9424C|nr:TRAP transporter substrate-binding protein [Lentibacter sp. XHP0401]MCV2892625.1 TRAP transporter substrate-binding protein [Lentibacter sp. XHP0401]
MSRLTTLAAAAAVTATSFATTVFAQTTLNLANEYQDTTFAAVADKFFIEKVEELTSDSVKINYFPGGSLGFKSADHFDATGDGAIEIADTFIGRLAGIDPVFSLPSMPFLATDKGKALALEAVLRPEYDRAFGAANQIYLFSTPWPPSGIWTKEPLTSPEDLQGLKIRVADVPSMQTFKSAGANPLEISWGDVVPQLSAGAIDAVVSSAEGGTNIKLGDFLPYYTTVDYVIPANVVHMNKDAFDALSADEQAAVLQAASETSTFIWAKLEERLSNTYNDLAELKVNVNREVDPALMDALAKASAGALDEWKAKMGDKGQVILDAFAAATN